MAAPVDAPFFSLGSSTWHYNRVPFVYNSEMGLKYKNHSRIIALRQHDREAMAILNKWIDQITSIHDRRQEMQGIAELLASLHEWLRISNFCPRFLLTHEAALARDVYLKLAELDFGDWAHQLNAAFIREHYPTNDAGHSYQGFGALNKDFAWDWADRTIWWSGHRQGLPRMSYSWPDIVDAAMFECAELKGWEDFRRVVIAAHQNRERVHPDPDCGEQGAAARTIRTHGETAAKLRIACSV